MKCKTVMVALVAVALLTAGWTADASLYPGYESVVLVGHFGNPMLFFERLQSDGTYVATQFPPVGKTLIITEMDVKIDPSVFEALNGGQVSIIFGSPEEQKTAFITKITERVFNVNMTTGLAVKARASWTVYFEGPPGTQPPSAVGIVILRGYFIPAELPKIPHFPKPLLP